MGEKLIAIFATKRWNRGEIVGIFQEYFGIRLPNL